MTNSPLITVLMPTYNCEQYVCEAIESILNQTYTNFECIIIDDCSTDATVDVIKAFYDERINLIEKPKNSGYTNSLNYGLTIAKGKYIARMDGDGISLPIGIKYTEIEKQAYIKQFSFTDRLNFEELKALIKLKKKAISANLNAYFKQEELKRILGKFQEDAINQYFKSNIKYSPKFTWEFIEISAMTNVNFSVLEKFKLFIKSIVLFKKI